MCSEEASFVGMIVFENLSGHIARATTSLVTWSNFFTWKTDRHSVLYTDQWLRQRRIFPMFARRVYFYKLWNNTSYLIFSLILKCLAGINCCVTIRTWVEQYGKAKIRKNKEIKIGFSVYFWNILPPNMV